MSFSISRPAFWRSAAPRRALHDAGDANLVRHLGELPRAGGAHQIAGARVGGDHFFGRRERRRLAAAHHREHAVLGAGLAAGDRRVDEFKAAFLCLGMKFARDLGRGGGVIDHDGARPHAGEYALLAQHHLAQIVVVADAGHDEVLACRRLPRRRGAFAAVLGNPLFGLGRGAVENRHLVAALGLEMPRHRVAHHAKSDKRHLRHRVLQRSECLYQCCPVFRHPEVRADGSGSSGRTV